MKHIFRLNRKKSKLKYPQKEINSIIYYVELTKVVSDFTELIKCNKGQYRGKCPICDGFSERHFRINTKKGLWKCFNCGCGGTNPISFIMLYFEIPFDRALKYLNDRYVRNKLNGTIINSESKESCTGDLPF